MIAFFKFRPVLPITNCDGLRFDPSPPVFPGSIASPSFRHLPQTPLFPYSVPRSVRLLIAPAVSPKTGFLNFRVSSSRPVLFVVTSYFSKELRCFVILVFSFQITPPQLLFDLLVVELRLLTLPYIPPMTASIGHPPTQFFITPKTLWPIHRHTIC